MTSSNSGGLPVYTPAAGQVAIATVPAVARPITDQHHAIFKTKPLIKLNLVKISNERVWIRLKDLIQEPTYFFTVPHRAHRGRAYKNSRYIILRTKPFVQIDLGGIHGHKIRVKLKDIIAEDDNELLPDEARPGLWTKLREKLHI